MTYFDSAVSKGFKGIASAKKSIAFGLVQLDGVSKVLDYDSSRESSLRRKDVCTTVNTSPQLVGEMLDYDSSHRSATFHALSLWIAKGWEHDSVPQSFSGGKRVPDDIQCNLSLRSKRCGSTTNIFSPLWGNCLSHKSASFMKKMCRSRSSWKLSSLFQASQQPLEHSALCCKCRSRSSCTFTYIEEVEVLEYAFVDIPLLKRQSLKEVPLSFSRKFILHTISHLYSLSMQMPRENSILSVQKLETLLQRKRHVEIHPKKSRQHHDESKNLCIETRLHHADTNHEHDLNKTKSCWPTQCDAVAKVLQERRAVVHIQGHHGLFPIDDVLE